jgi:excisionase family DNA binding protein
MQILSHTITSTEEKAFVEQNSVPKVNDTTSFTSKSDDTLLVSTITETEELLEPILPLIEAPESEKLLLGVPERQGINENFVVDSQNFLPGLSILSGRTTIYLHLLERYEEKFNYSKKYKEDFINVTAVSELLQLSKSSVYRLIKTKKLKASKMHREWYFTMTHVDEYIRKYVLW